MFLCVYRQASNISGILVCNEIVDHSDVIAAPLIGAISELKMAHHQNGHFVTNLSKILIKKGVDKLGLKMPAIISRPQVLTIWDNGSWNWHNTFDQCIECSSCKEILYLAALINLKTVLKMLYLINQQSPAPTAANICNYPRPIKMHYINFLRHCFLNACIQCFAKTCPPWQTHYFEPGKLFMPQNNSKFASQYWLIIMAFDQCIIYEYWWGSNWIVCIRIVYACCACLYLSVGIVVVWMSHNAMAPLLLTWVYLA